MRAKFMLLAPIVCVVVGACGSPGAPRAAANPVAATPEAVDWGPARYIPHDYPGPALRGGGGGG